MKPTNSELPPIDDITLKATVNDLSNHLRENDVHYSQIYSRVLRNTLVDLEKQKFEIPPRLIRFISECWETQQPTRLDTFLADQKYLDDIDSKIMICIDQITQLMIIIWDTTRNAEEVLVALRDFESSLDNLSPYLKHALLSACWPNIEQGLDIRDNRA